MFNIFKYIKNLYSKKNSFFDYERFILERVTENLNGELAVIASRQINELSFHARNFGGKEVQFSYHHNNSGQSFACMGEREFMRFTVQRADNETMKVDVLINGGGLGSIIFRGYPKKFFRRVNFSSNPPRIIESKLLCNPMIPDNNLSEEKIDPTKLTGWVKSCYDRGFFTDLRRPLEQNERESYLAGFDTKFPDDYLEFLNQADYGELNGHLPVGKEPVEECVDPKPWVYGNLIKGLRTYDPIIRGLLHKGLYYMIADVGLIGPLVVCAGDYTGEVVLLKNDDGLWETPLNTTSLVDAINKTLQILYEKHEVAVSEQIYI